MSDQEVRTARNSARVRVGVRRPEGARDWPWGRIALLAVGEHGDAVLLTPNTARRLVARIEAAIREAETR